MNELRSEANRKIAEQVFERRRQSCLGDWNIPKTSEESDVYSIAMSQELAKLVT